MKRVLSLMLAVLLLLVLSLSVLALGGKTDAATAADATLEGEHEDWAVTEPAGASPKTGVNMYPWLPVVTIACSGAVILVSRKLRA